MPYVNSTVFIIDPDESVRESLESVLRRRGWIAEPCASATAFLARQPQLAPSCLLIDITLPDPTAFELLRRIATERKETPIIVIAAWSDTPMTVRAMKAGAVEFLLKPLAEDELLAVVRQALATSHAILEDEAELVDLRKRYECLSVREREVMEGVVTGSLNKHIGAALGISEITVKAHRGRAMRKMRAESLASLVAMALRLRLPCAAVTPRPRLDTPRARSEITRGSPLSAFAVAS
jgi:FixJ family two-component response regulator